MKKILLAVLMIIVGACSASAVSYRGFLDFHFGSYYPSQYYKNGPEFGFSTSHGVELIPGVYVGLGTDLVIGDYDDSQGDEYEGPNTLVGYFNTYIEGKYRFLPNKPVSPFVGFRLGAGLGGDESGDDYMYPYISPSLGVSFNLSRRFGIDLGCGYVFHGRNTTILKSESLLTPPTTINVYNSSIQFRIGFHF